MSNLVKHKKHIQVSLKLAPWAKKEFAQTFFFSAYIKLSIKIKVEEFEL